MTIRETFHKLIGYKFKNDEGHVKTAYLDTYFHKYRNKSDTSDYTLHQHAFLQFSLYFVNHPVRFTQAQLEKIFQYLTPDVMQRLKYYTQDILNIIHDFAAGSSYVHIFISQVLQKYNMLISNLEYLKQKLDNVKPFLLPTIRYHYPSPIHSYQSREKVLTHKKGHRGFVVDYEYKTYW